MLEVQDIRQLAIHVQCRTSNTRSAREDFVRRMNALISRAPKIRWWQ